MGVLAIDCTHIMWGPYGICLHRSLMCHHHSFRTCRFSLISGTRSRRRRTVLCLPAFAAAAAATSILPEIRGSDAPPHGGALQSASTYQPRNRGCSLPSNPLALVSLAMEWSGNWRVRGPASQESVDSTEADHFGHEPSVSTI